MVHWEKQNTMLHVLNFKKGVTHLFNRLYGFLIHYIFKMKLSALNLLRKQEMFKVAATDMRYFTRSNYSTSLVHKKHFSFI